MRTKFDKLKAIGILFNGIGVFIKAILSLIRYIEVKRVNRMIKEEENDPMIWNFPDERSMYYK